MNLNLKKLFDAEVENNALYLRTKNIDIFRVFNDLNLKVYEGDNLYVFNDFEKYSQFIKDFNSDSKNIYACNNLLNAYIFSNVDHFDLSISDYNVCNFDIETGYDINDGYGTTSDPHQAILTICLKINDEKPFILTTKKIDFELEYPFLYFEEEGKMLEYFINMIRNENIHILTGWNIKFFDIPYFVARSKRIGVDYKKLSPIGKVMPMIDADLEETYYKIKMVHTIDYCQLYKKFNYLNEVYLKLNTIVQKELDSKKIEYLNEFDNLRDLYDKDYKKFLEYNARDVELVNDLEVKLNFLALTVKIQSICMNPNLEDIFSTLQNSISLTIKYWLKKYNKFPDYLDQSSIKKLRDKNESYGSIIGGYVTKPKPDVYTNICVLDFTSLYPSIIRTFNIGKDSYLGYTPNLKISRPMYLQSDNSKEYIKKRDLYFKEIMKFLKSNKNNVNENYQNNLTANGIIYDSSEPSVLSNMMTDLFEQRVLIRNKIKENGYSISLHLEQLAYKILLNSQFGALGNKFFIYGSYELAESITSTGQYIIKSVIDTLKKSNLDVIYSDTDSLFISLKNFQTEEEIQAYIKSELKPRINRCISDICTTELHTNNKICLDMQLENIYQKGIFWSTKKRYYLKQFNGNVTAKGISSVKSDLSQAYKNIFNQCIEKKMNYEDNLSIINYLNEVKDQYKNDLLSFALQTQLKYNIQKYKSSEIEKLETLKKSHLKVYELINCPPIDDLNNEEVSKIIDIYLEITKRSTKKYVLKAYEFLKEPYIQGTPAHFKGAFIFNERVRKYNLLKKYELITGGIRIMRLPLKSEFNNLWISIPIKYESHFDWDVVKIDEIDYDTLFDKNVVEKIKCEILNK